MCGQLLHMTSSVFFMPKILEINTQSLAMRKKFCGISPACCLLL